MRDGKMPDCRESCLFCQKRGGTGHRRAVNASRDATFPRKPRRALQKPILSCPIPFSRLYDKQTRGSNVYSHSCTTTGSRCLGKLASCLLQRPETQSELRSGLSHQPSWIARIVRWIKLIFSPRISPWNVHPLSPPPPQQTFNRCFPILLN